MTFLAGLHHGITSTPTLVSGGHVTAIRGSVLTAQIPNVAIGDLCMVSRRNQPPLRGQVVSFARNEVCIAPFDDTEGISPGAELFSAGTPPHLHLSHALIGSVVNCFAEQIDSKSAPDIFALGPLSTGVKPSRVGPLEHALIRDALETGVAAIDGFCTLGYGQRIGLFAGAGVGKSTLLGMIARHADVDVTVIALIGERGREIREFIEECLGPEDMKRAVLVVATSDEAPIRRAMAIETATAIAEYFRAQNQRVLLLVDSLTRAARAMRDVALGAGELPIRQGYTASVFATLPKIIERAGADSSGSITGIYTVLTHGEGEVDALREEVKSLLDGHIMLEPALAERGCRPAIDIGASLSRVMSRVQTSEHLQTAQTIRAMLARLKRDRDLLLFGGTADAELSAAIAAEPALWKVLNQSPDESRGIADTLAKLADIAISFRSQSARSSSAA